MSVSSDPGKKGSVRAQSGSVAEVSDTVTGSDGTDVDDPLVGTTVDEFGGTSAVPVVTVALVTEAVGSSDTPPHATTKQAPKAHKNMRMPG